MYKYILIIIIVLLGCKKEEQRYHTGDFTVSMNDVDLSGITETRGRDSCSEFGSFPCLSLGMEIKNDLGQTRFVMGVTNVPVEEGTFLLTGNELILDSLYSISGFQRLSDGDVVGGSYRPVDYSSKNYIEVEELNIQSDRIKVNFEAILIRDTSVFSAPNTMVDTITITNCQYNGVINWL